MKYTVTKHLTLRFECKANSKQEAEKKCMAADDADMEVLDASYEVERVAKMKPYTPEWEAMANAEARSYCPAITPCSECGAPHIKGYCCNHCGSVNP